MKPRLIWGAGLASLVVIGAFSAGTQNTAAQAPACSAATLSGTYGIQMQGIRAVPPALGGGVESVIGVIIRTYDGQGGLTQIDNIKGSVTGIVPDRPGSGTYQVNADCSGMATFQPAPGVTLTERIVVVEGGAQIWSITESPANVMVSSVQRRASGSQGPGITPPSVPCVGPDPFASIPTLVGECVNGGWVPRVR